MKRLLTAILACLSILGARPTFATEFDAETGLMHMGARDYDPETGRFLQEDPILQDGPSSDPKLFQQMNVVDSMHGSSSLYQYAFNNPTNYSDPTGTFPIGWLLPWIIANPANAPGLGEPTYSPVISDADLAAMNALGAGELLEGAAASCEVTGAIVGKSRGSRLLGLRYKGGKLFFTDKNGFFFAIDKAGHLFHIGPWRPF